MSVPVVDLGCNLLSNVVVKLVNLPVDPAFELVFVALAARELVTFVIIGLALVFVLAVLHGFNDEYFLLKGLFELGDLQLQLLSIVRDLLLL